MARYEVNHERILLQDGIHYISQPIEELGAVRNITIAGRGDGGVIEELVIEGEKATVKVITEYNVRYVLNNGTAVVRRQDGSEASMPSLLPSAFFIIETGKEDDCVVGYKLTGGGYGHGVGMSQNAAKAMAAQGISSDDILGFFYDKSEIKNIYGSI